MNIPKKLKNFVNKNDKSLNSSESFPIETTSSNGNSKDSFEELIKGLSLNTTEDIIEEKKL